MTAEEMFNMSNDEFIKKVKEESTFDSNEIIPNSEPETLDEQIQKFSEFKQSKEDIQKLLKAAKNI